MHTRRLRAVLVLGLVLFAAAAAGTELTKLKGWIVGQKCAEQGKIGECYLQWAHPMVFWTEGGETYAIDLPGSGIKQERLDEAYGQEVELYGRISRDKQGERVQISQLNILKPPGAKEFFKG
jgi:hypothetical protein